MAKIYIQEMYIQRHNFYWKVKANCREYIFELLSQYELNAFKDVLEPWKDLLSDWNFPGFFQFPGKTHNSRDVENLSEFNPFDTNFFKSFLSEI